MSIPLFVKFRNFDPNKGKIKENERFLPLISCGMLTQGGTESIGLAILAARNRAFSKGIKWPEIVMGHTVHSAADKAAHYFRVKLVKVGYQSDYKSNVKVTVRI